MNDNESTNSSIPLFYIIQPVNRSKLIVQNMQEIYHSKGSIEEEAENNLEMVKAVKNEDKEDLQIEETFEENTDIITEDHLLKGKTSQSEDDLNLEENMEVQVEREMLKDDLRMKLIRLARYPAVVQKPFCEIKFGGESIIGQIESKRGEILKIKVGEGIRFLAIDDIDELSIL